MTIEEIEFENYLKSIGGLINGRFPDREPLIYNFCACEDGWLNTVIKPLITELISIGWDKEITDIKEKWGTLSFYTTNLPEGGFEIVRKYEKLSGETCEICGSTDNAEVRKVKGWYKCLCQKHYNEYEKS